MVKIKVDTDRQTQTGEILAAPKFHSRGIKIMSVYIIPITMWLIALFVCIPLFGKWLWFLGLFQDLELKDTYSTFLTSHVFVKHGCTGGNKVKIWQSYIFTPPHPKGHAMSVKCEQPLDELTVQVCLLYYHQNLHLNYM